MKIGVVGLGVVGTEVKKWFKGSLGYDPNKDSDSWEDVSQCDIFFISVPTPYKDGEEYDLSYLEDAISKIPDGKIVVIKSTVNPGTTDHFQSKYPDKIFMFNPEFLTELSAEDDFVHPDMQILGVPHQGYKYASEVILMLPPAKTMRVVSPVDAEWIKKSRNAYYATKVVWFNQLYDFIKKSYPVADFETIRSVLVTDPSIGNSHSFPFHKGGRGGGGKCLPKDLNSLVDYAHKYDFYGILDQVRELNEQYLKNNPKDKIDNIQAL
jgi:UDPglucose 6-dehydrogenase